MEDDKMLPCIFNIQKFSLHDGPGIRTVVFFKGCPLACKWCSNPESQNPLIEITWDKSKCIHCLRCVQICPQKAITHVNDKIIIDRRKCDGCLKCVDGCSQNALNNEGEFKEINDIINEILKDLPFYEESNGGVTLSGGEVLSQYKQAIELIKECKKHNLHVAIETTGYGARDEFKALIEDVDLLLFDMKHYDSDKHFEGTGVYNEIIIENMTYAVKSGKIIIARIPVIPDFNDSLKDALEFSKLLKNIGIKDVNLLPFHQFGQRKYELLNREYSLKLVKQLHPEDLKDYQKVFLDEGLNCYF
ncbi:glycyl-radical enzyme activating protein [Caproiciproducens sp. MSJ-32]|nr:glycyl-radical enzyme activating protein [Caproiciproducens sp. MSJ-32]